MYRKKVQETQKTRRMSLPAALCGICILTAVFLGCSGFGFSGSPKVDLDQYVSLDAYGYDGYGSASIYIDWNRIAEDCGKEESQETEYTSCRTMWATDDINVRETSTMDEDNIVYAIYKGESVTVVGETPNWYKISIPYTDDNGESKEFIGFVSKQYLSDSEPSGTAVQSETAAAESADEEAEPADGAEKQADSGTGRAVQPTGTEVLTNETVLVGTQNLFVKGASFATEIKAKNAAEDSMTVKAKDGKVFLLVNIDLSAGESYIPSEVLTGASLLIDGSEMDADQIYAMTDSRDGTNGASYSDRYLVKIEVARETYAGEDLVAAFSLPESLEQTAGPVYFQFTAGGQDYYYEVDLAEALQAGADQTQES